MTPQMIHQAGSPAAATIPPDASRVTAHRADAPAPLSHRRTAAPHRRTAAPQTLPGDLGLGGTSAARLPGVTSHILNPIPA